MDYYKIVVCYKINMKANKKGKYVSIILLTNLIFLFSTCNRASKAIIGNDEYITVKGGTFLMGSENGEDYEKPIHSVTISDFKIGKYEVTNAQFCEFLNEEGNGEGGGGTWLYLEHSKIEKKGTQFTSKSGYGNHPVVVVSWEGANEFAKWKGARLPTEAEWEFAAKGGNITKGYTYSGSNQIEEVAWYEKNSENKTHPVGQKQPNELEIFDMSGNVWEWCNDWFNEEYYSSSENQNPRGPGIGTAKVLRGGEVDFNEKFCRVDNRYSISPHARNTRIGFRLVKEM